VRPVPPGWGYYPPPPGPRRPALSGVTVLVLVTVLAALAALHAHQLGGMVEAGAGALPAIRLPQLPQPLPTGCRPPEPPRPWPMPSPSGASRIAGEPKALTPSTARG
jgi:hypothetical protein